MMSVITPVTPTWSGTLTPSALYRMTVDEFERIAGALDDDHVELIDGYIVGRAEMKPSHALAAELFKHSLGNILPAGFHLREDKPVRIPELNEPRPDFSIVRGDPRVYAARHPGPLDVLLVVEISDTTLQRDRGEKLLSYGRSGIPVYWIVNLVDHQVEIYSDPTADGYASKLVFAPSLQAQSAPVTVDGIEFGQIDVTQILP
jgi:Uma2 family endonuclease